MASKTVTGRGYVTRSQRISRSRALTCQLVRIIIIIIVIVIPSSIDSGEG